MSSARYRLWWTAADGWTSPSTGHGSLDGGLYATREAAEQALEEWRERLLSEPFADDHWRDMIRFGRFSIEEVGGE